MPERLMGLSEQQIRFCTSADGVRIAYATVGTGPPLVKAANWLSHLEFDWGSPVWRHWLRELSRHRTLVRYDERGCGLSDWNAEEYSLDAWVRDLEAVVDALGLERFPLLGISQGGPIAIAYTMQHPDRVSHLVLYGSYACGREHRKLSEREREERQLMLQMIRVGWGQDHAAFRQVFTSLFVPDATPEQARWFNELQRVSAPPENAFRLVSAFDKLDVRALAPRLDVPTLVLHATGDLRIPFAAGRELAALIPGARLVPLDSRNHLLLEDEPAWGRFLRAVREFLGDPTTAEPAPRPAFGPTSDARRRRIEALFDEAFDLPPEARTGFLDAACGADPEVRREVEALLRSAEDTGITTRLAGALARAAADAESPAPAGLQRSVLHYKLLEKLGSGGMGVVYKALDRRLHRTVAVKFLPPWLGHEPEMKQRFLQEAKAAASLDHPNICTIYGVEEAEDGHLFIVMPCYEGETLAAKIARGPLALDEALDLGGQLAAGLAYAHAAGVVHRDVKPANVVITREGRVKILDFGIAKVADAHLTRTGTVLGTLAYMSPEQAAGERVDHSTDLWALGVVLHEMIAGTPPFTAASREALYAAIQLHPAPRLSTLRSGVPERLETLVARLLEKEREHRRADAREVAATLADVRRVTAAPAGAQPFSG